MIFENIIIKEVSNNFKYYLICDIKYIVSIP